MKQSKSLQFLTTLLLPLSLACPAGSQAATIQLDFGPTLVLAADALRDPGHASGAVTNTEIIWNRITGDTNTLYYSDGTLAAGVTLELGRSTAVGPAGTDIIDFADNGFTVNALGSVMNTGIYAGTSPVRDGIFGGANGTNNLAVGVRVNGLPAGTYRILVHGRNSNTSGPGGLLFYATNGASAATYAFSTNNATAALANTGLLAPIWPITSGFVEGDNFGVLVITIAAGESLYIASEGTTLAEMRGFMNAISIVSGAPNLPAKITAHPAGRTQLETASAVFLADGWGTPPVSFKQWRLNATNVLTDGPNISGANSNVLTLRNITPAMAGNYSLFVSNALGTDISSNALLVVTPVLNTEQMTNIWNLVPGDRPYISTANTERGLAYNSLTTNLLVASRTPSNQIVVLNALTGAERHSLDLTGVADGTFPLNHVGVADDGAVYVANLTLTPTSPPYKIYRWANDSPGNPPVLVFTGDPAIGVQSNIRWGDSMAVRGSGADTQILIGPGVASTNVVLLRTISGNDFQTEIPPAVIAVSGVSSFGAVTLGVAFGPSTNTFWLKNASGQLMLIQFDLNSNTGTVIQSYSTAQVPAIVRGIGTDSGRKFLAGVAIETPNDNVRLYDVSNLAAGPLLRDQEAFATPTGNNANGTAATTFGANHLFALDSNYGIKAFAINTNYVPPSVSIVVNPTDRTVMEGASAVFTAAGTSSQPLVYQWRFNGTNLSNGPNVLGANTNTLVVANVTSNQAGGYYLFVSNAFGTATSSTGRLTVLPTFNTGQMTNIWSLQPGERNYLGTNTSTERGLAYNSATTNLLLVSRLPADPAVVVLDAQTGAEKHFLDTAGIPATVGGASLSVNVIGAADDGAVYGASVTVNATTTPVYLYRWDSDAAAAVRTTAFQGDPMATVQPGIGWGDAMAVRGTGTATQILLPPRTGTNMVLFTTANGVDFAPTVIPITGAGNGFAQLGVAFGPGTNAFWAKTVGQQLLLVQFDLTSNTGAVLYAYSNAVPLNLRAISVGLNQKFLAGITTDTSPNVRLYDASDLLAGPVLRDQEVFATQNANTTVGGTGATAFGGNYLFALDSNNGIKAFLINTNFVPPLSPFSITSVTQSGAAVVFTWQSVAGRNYQVQFKDAISSANWSNVGSVITAAGTATSFTNTTSDTASKFYRVQGQ